MIKAGPTHEIVSTNTFDEPVYSSPAIANGRIYIRAEKHLFAIGSPELIHPQPLARPWRGPERPVKG